jgi:hypothetical protein
MQYEVWDDAVSIIDLKMGIKINYQIKKNLILHFLVKKTHYYNFRFCLNSVVLGDLQY